MVRICFRNASLTQLIMRFQIGKSQLYHDVTEYVREEMNRADRLEGGSQVTWLGLH